jgi:hypothetical protein
MREWFQFIEIRPINEFLDFIGPPREPSADTSQTIKGEVSLVLIKPVKIKSMIVKLKGSSTAYHPRTPDRCEIVSPILPKLKKSLFSNKSTLLPAGKHILPWELDVPNIYPRSMQIKRGSISYKVEISISLGINKKNIVEEYPITIRRHLLPSKELAPLVSVKTYKNTVPTKFHYEIEAPRIVCVEQNHFPASIKCMSIGNQKKVKSIRTQLIQVEIYRYVFTKLCISQYVLSPII